MLMSTMKVSRQTRPSAAVNFARSSALRNTKRHAPRQPPARARSSTARQSTDRADGPHGVVPLLLLVMVLLLLLASSSSKSSEQG